MNPNFNYHPDIPADHISEQQSLLALGAVTDFVALMDKNFRVKPESIAGYNVVLQNDSMDGSSTVYHIQYSSKEQNPDLVGAHYFRLVSEHLVGTGTGDIGRIAEEYVLQWDKGLLIIPETKYSFYNMAYEIIKREGVKLHTTTNALSPIALVSKKDTENLRPDWVAPENYVDYGWLDLVSNFSNIDTHRLKQLFEIMKECAQSTKID